MGTHNKERRRQKKSARAKARRDQNRTDRGQGGRRAARNPFSSSWADAGGPHVPSRRQIVAELVYRAAHALCEGRSDGELLVARLARADFGADGRRLVTDELESSLVSLQALLLVNGWEPVDLWEAARRQAGAGGAGLLAGLVRAAVLRVTPPEALRAREAQCAGIPGRWRLDPSGSEWPGAVATAVKLVEVLGHLPALKSLAPDSAAAQDEADSAHGALLSKIRRLLAKAESTEFSEEADACTAKATELMHRHRIDQAAVEARTGLSKGSDVTSRRWWIEAPYVEAKAVLVDVVATANGCRAVRDELGFVTVVGSLGDLELSEVLFTSLLVQATNQMAIAGRTASPGAVGPVTKRKRNPSFRRSFLIAYATRIEARLADAERSATRAATAELGCDFLPVLAREHRRVEDAVARLFGELTTTTIRVTDAAGFLAGTAAADLADLNVRDELRTG